MWRKEREQKNRIPFALLWQQSHDLSKDLSEVYAYNFSMFSEPASFEESSLISYISKESSKDVCLENIEKLYAQNYERFFDKSWDCCQSRANGMRYFFSLTFKYYIKWGLPSFSITYYKSIGSTYIHILTSFDCFKRLVGKSSISFLTLLNIHECDLVSMGNKQASSSSADRLSRPRHRFFHVIVF